MWPYSISSIIISWTRGPGASCWGKTNEHVHNPLIYSLSVDRLISTDYFQPPLFSCVSLLCICTRAQPFCQQLLFKSLLFILSGTNVRKLSLYMSFFSYELIPTSFFIIIIILWTRRFGASWWGWGGREGGIKEKGAPQDWCSAVADKLTNHDNLCTGISKMEASVGNKERQSRTDHLLHCSGEKQS